MYTMCRLIQTNTTEHTQKKNNKKKIQEAHLLEKS